MTHNYRYWPIIFVFFILYELSCLHFYHERERNILQFCLKEKKKCIFHLNIIQLNFKRENELKLRLI